MGKFMLADGLYNIHVVAGWHYYSVVPILVEIFRVLLSCHAKPNVADSGMCGEVFVEEAEFHWGPKLLAISLDS